MNDERRSSFLAKVLLRQPLASVRLVIALFTVTAAITKILYDRFLPSMHDFEEVRWSIIALGTVCFICTYVSFKRGKIVTYFSLFLYLSTLAYVIAFVLVNRFNPHAVTILILVVGASSVIINSLFYYGVQSVLIILACLVFYSGALGTHENFISFLNLMIAMGVFGIVMTVRLKLISSIKNSHSSLEKLNVVSLVANKSGEIVFVSPSVQTLLGYKPKELMKEGWWGIGNVRDGWISREYILNYPNILPKEIMQIETSLRNKDGKTVWLSWVNSMLPNGNYMGVGLDITKYKDPEVASVVSH